MNVKVTAPSLRSQWGWHLRLMAIALRRHRLVTAAGCCAFAVATLAVFTCLATFSGWRGVNPSG